VRVKKVIIINRTLERAERLKTELLQSNSESASSEISTLVLTDEEAVHRAVQIADVMVTATNSCVPLFDGKLVKPGCHINGVGSVS
jgi:ornithine cyclodeaminase